MERGQLEYSMEFSRVPFTLPWFAGLRWGGGVLLRLPLSMQRDWRCDPTPPHPLSWSSPATLVIEEQDVLLETLPSDEARCGRLILPLPSDRALSIGRGTGTKGDAIFLSCVLLPSYRSCQQGFLNLN